MLDTRQFLLTKLAEECVEVAQRALKQQQFGRDEIEPGHDKTNGERLFGEIIDLITVVGLLENIKEIPILSMGESDELVAGKQAKILKYRQYSQKLGFVEPDRCLRCGVGRDHDQDGDCGICHKLPDSHAADLKEAR